MTYEEKIAGRIDPASANSLAVTEQAGGLSFTNAEQAMTFAKMMAVGGVAVPKHLRGNPGACLAIVVQAIEWRLSPYAVANKSYSVNDRLAYESQLVQAVILQRAPIKGRLKVEYTGEGDSRVCRVWADLKDLDESVEYVSPPRGRITPQNSPLWKSDPDQQLFYYSARALCRRHFPDVLLGVYARDELEDSPRIGPDRARDVTPPRTIAEKLDALAQAQDAVPDPEDDFSQPIPQHVTLDVGPDAFDEPDMFESVRARARADAEKKLKRMAPTSLSDAERAIYLQAFDAHRAAETDG